MCDSVGRGDTTVDIFSLRRAAPPRTIMTHPHPSHLLAGLARGELIIATAPTPSPPHPTCWRRPSLSSFMLMLPLWSASSCWNSSCGQGAVGKERREGQAERHRRPAAGTTPVNREQAAGREGRDEGKEGLVAMHRRPPTSTQSAPRPAHCHPPARLPHL